MHMVYIAVIGGRERDMQRLGRPEEGAKEMNKDMYERSYLILHHSSVHACLVMQLACMSCDAACMHVL